MFDIELHRGLSEESSASSLNYGPSKEPPELGQILHGAALRQAHISTASIRTRDDKGKNLFSPRPPLHLLSCTFVSPFVSCSFSTEKLRVSGAIRHDTLPMAHRFACGFTTTGFWLCINGQPIRCRSSAVRLSAKPQYGSCSSR